ncbi:MAG: GntR family transcriptional regulator [Hyphomonadaceae bacterium]
MTKRSPRTKAKALRTPDARVSALGIARDTARDIERGVYQPGARLREQALADKFHCSRAPVREALRLLESQGSVVIEPMRGARIATPQDPTFYEVFLIRRALAGLMAQQAALAKHDEAKIHFVAAARGLPARARAAVDGHAFAKSIRKAIGALIAVSRTPRTVQLVRSLTFGHEAFQDEIVDIKKNRLAQANLWRDMADAAEAGDANAARAAMEGIFDNSRDFVAGRLPTETPKRRPTRRQAE